MSGIDFMSMCARGTEVRRYRFVDTQLERTCNLNLPVRSSLELPVRPSLDLPVRPSLELPVRPNLELPVLAWTGALVRYKLGYNDLS